MQQTTKLLILIGIIFIIQACGGSSNSNTSTNTPEAPVSNTIVDVAAADDRFTTLTEALQATGLDTTLADTNNTFTVFAPTDDAFALLGEETMASLLADTETLSDILTYHVIASEVNAAAAISSAGNTVEMVNGDKVGLSLQNDSLLVNQATVIITDIDADNGVIHVIDAVLIPPTDKGTPELNLVETAVDAGNFTTLVSLLETTGLDATLADPGINYTVFAPTDEAFAMIDADTLEILLNNPDVLSSILLQHVIAAEVDSVTAYTFNGEDVATAAEAMIPITINSTTDLLTFGGANITTKDIYTTNGVIHVIDTVVIADVSIPQPEESITDIAMANDDLTTLHSALQVTGLDSVLGDISSEFTIFAPTDTAFAALAPEILESLLSDPQSLIDILLYHVIPDSTILADSAVATAQSANNKIAMGNEQMAALSLNGTDLYINTANVVITDVLAANGVIHIIDSLIMPPVEADEPTMNIVDVATGDQQFSTLVEALTAAELVDTLADETANFTVFAPTNAAFAKIENNTLTDLLANTEALSTVLLQHVISDGQISSIDAYAANGDMVDTVSGEDVAVKLVDFSKTTNDSNDEVAYHPLSQILVAGQGDNMAGKTLYVYDSDLGMSSSVCNQTCAENWPPLLVTDGEVSNIPGLSTVMRNDGSMQAAYLGRPLYLYSGDTEVGDMNGQGLSDAWWTVELPKVSLQIQGSNVITKDIYTTNGVIHVIDTVITETLE